MLAALLSDCANLNNLRVIVLLAITLV